MCGDRPADNADRFCFMQAAARAVHATGKVTSNVCVDVAGENPKPGGQLIGYEHLT